MRTSLRRGMIAAALAATLPGLAATGPALASAAGPGAAGRAAAGCSAGAHTLAPPGSHVYPETGNGGYVSVHTDVHMIYDAARNRFLPGNHVTLQDRATQCLTSLSLDLERRSTANVADGPDLTVRRVQVNGTAGQLPVRAADVPRRPARAGRPATRRAPGLREPPRGRATAQHAAAGLHPRAALHLVRHPQRAERHAVPGQQTGHHPGRAAAQRVGLHRHRATTPAGPACTPTATAPPRAGSGRTSRPVTAGSSPPSRSAPRTGCR